MSDQNNTTITDDLSITTKLVFTCCYITIFFIGLLGNILVCIVIIKDLRRSVTNIFLFNLSCADILNIILVIPSTTIIDLWIGYWPFDIIMCKSLPFLQCLTIVVTSFTYVIISTDRFFVVFYPMRARLTLKKSKGILCGIWAISAALGFPLLIVSKVEHSPPKCQEAWSTKASTVYSMILLTTQYFVPLFFILSTYSAIAARVWLQQAPGERDENRDRRLAKSKRKMVKMMIAVSLAYAISQLPRHITWLYLFYSQGFQWANLIWNIVVLLQISSTCYNPIIYCWMNHSYRHRFIYYLCVLTKMNAFRQLNPPKFRTNTNTEFSSGMLTQYVKQNPNIDKSRYLTAGILKSKPAYPSEGMELDDKLISYPTNPSAIVHFKAISDHKL
uniref:GCR361 n=1 Tax=Schmidtea mediterranea TaxID=79327 RepID=A0A193KUH4_SCHMD|nr:GCR361 [Schmidtea mediterranea]